MDKQLVTTAVIELLGGLLRSALEFARTTGIEAEQLDAAFLQAKSEFEANDPSNISFLD